MRFNVTVNFTDLDGKTEIDFRLVFDTPAMRDEAAQFGAIEGLFDTLSRLAAHLEEKSRTPG